MALEADCTVSLWVNAEKNKRAEPKKNWSILKSDENQKGNENKGGERLVDFTTKMDETKDVCSNFVKYTNIQRWWKQNAIEPKGTSFAVIITVLADDNQHLFDTLNNIHTYKYRFVNKKN